MSGGSTWGLAYKSTCFSRMLGKFLVLHLLVPCCGLAEFRKADQKIEAHYTDGDRMWDL